MRNLQGIIRRLTTNTVNQFERLGGHSENLSNMNTNTYKTKGFANIINEDGYVIEVGRRNHTQGELKRTASPFDIAINGSGFIPITTKNGEILYTRDGSFTTDKNGMLVTYGGDVIGSGIKIDPNYAKLEIKKNGEVCTYETLLSEPKVCGKISLVNFNNPEGLEEIGANNYKKTEKSGEAELIEDHEKITQYHVEISNMDIFSEVNDVMRTNASLMAAQTLMDAIDKMYEKAINIRE